MARIDIMQDLDDLDPSNRPTYDDLVRCVNEAAEALDPESEDFDPERAASLIYTMQGRLI